MARIPPRQTHAVLSSGDAVNIGDCRIRVHDTLGHGSFGCVYRVEDLDTHVYMAMKVETGQPAFSQLDYENKIYRALSGTTGIPKVHGYHHDKKKKLRYMLLDLLGSNLYEVLKNAPGGTLPLRHVCIIGLRTLQRLRDMHGRGLLHRDVKPQNFLLGADKAAGKSTVWAVDFGLVKPFRNKDGTHMPDKEKKGLTGTPRFASRYTHLGHENSRRDDLESLMYMLAFLFRGNLPWQDVKVPPGMRPKSSRGRAWKNNRILELKQAQDVRELFLGMPGFLELATYVHKLGFEETPDYDRIRDTLMMTYHGTGKKTHGARKQVPNETVETRGVSPHPRPSLV